MQLMIWNSFNLKSSESEPSSETILDPYLLNEYEACRERVFTFRYKRHIFSNGTEKWDMTHRAELGIASNAFGTKTSAIGIIHFKPGKRNGEPRQQKNFFFFLFRIVTILKSLQRYAIITCVITVNRKLPSPDHS